MTPPRICALAGRRRSGKDALAALLAAATPGLAVVNFSDPLVNDCDAMLAVHGMAVDVADKDRFRPLLQWWGQVRRSQDPAWMADAAIALAVARLDEGATGVIICGAREPATDLVPLIDAGVPLAKVERADRPTDASDLHPNEQAIERFDFDVVLANVATPDWREHLLGEGLRWWEAIAAGAPSGGRPLG